MKVEIEIKKKDLRSILCAAIHDYYREVKIQLESSNIYRWQTRNCDEVITDNLYEIRDACDAISNLCDMVEEVDTVDNDVRGVIRFDPDAEEQK